MESDISVSKTVSSLLTDQMNNVERQCWANAQYSRSECLEVVGIPSSVKKRIWKVRSPQFLVELVLPLIQMILKLDIGFIMTKKRLWNLQNVNSVNKFCEKRRNWKTLTLASLIFRKAQLYLSMEVCVLITERFSGQLLEKLDNVSNANLWTHF